MFFALSKILRYLVYPLPLFMLVVLGIVVLYHRVWARRALLVGLVLFYGLSIPYTADRCMQWLEPPRVAPEALRPPYDTVIVLTGMLHTPWSQRGYVEFSESVDRILAGMALVQQGLGKTLLVSGGSGSLFDRRTSEARLLKTFALQFGLRDDQVLVEAEARNTYENALYTIQILRAQQLRHVVLVTSASHMRRAVATFHKQGIFPDTYPVDYQAADGVTPFSFVPSVASLAKITAVLHELFGMLTYRWQGYI
jgi:uncharacterized SAM-binding protein YcdF (DUF218 family)